MIRKLFVCLLLAGVLIHLPVGKWAPVNIPGSEETTKLAMYCGMLNEHTFSIKADNFTGDGNIYYPTNIGTIDISYGFYNNRYNINMKIKSVTPTMLILERMD